MFRKIAMLFIALAVVAVQAEPAHRRTAQRRFLARQEAAAPAPAAPAPTGYPEAGVTPAVPFELPSSTTAKPDVTYLPPDNTYGRPAVAAEPQPDAVYGPPTGDEEEGQIPVDEAPIETDDIQPEAEEPEEEQQPNVKAEEDANAEEDDVVLAVSDDGTVIAVASSTDQAQGVPARIYQRFPQARRRQGPVPERLVLLNPKRFSYQFMQRTWQ